MSNGDQVCDREAHRVHGTHRLWTLKAREPSWTDLRLLHVCDNCIPWLIRGAPNS